jgi:thioredoxin 1
LNNAFQTLINGQTPVLVDFHAEWCGPCKMMPPILSELKSALGDGLKIIKIDVDKNPGIAGQLQVQGVPTLILYQAGQIKWRQSGVVPAHELKKIVESKTS